jgi:PAS domain S-box-containing protein
MATEIDPKDVAWLAEFHDRVEAAAREGAARFAEVWNRPPPGLAMHEIDMNKVIRRVNPEELKLLGYREDQMVGRPCFDFIVLKETSVRAIQQKLAGERQLAPFLRTFLKADGLAVTLLLMDRHIKDAAGRVTGIRTALKEVPSPPPLARRKG